MFSLFLCNYHSMAFFFSFVIIVFFVFLGDGSSFYNIWYLKTRLWTRPILVSFLGWINIDCRDNIDFCLENWFTHFLRSFFWWHQFPLRKLMLSKKQSSKDSIVSKSMLLFFGGHILPTYCFTSKNFIFHVSRNSSAHCDILICI